MEGSVYQFLFMRCFTCTQVNDSYIMELRVVSLYQSDVEWSEITQVQSESTAHDWIELKTKGLMMNYPPGNWHTKHLPFPDEFSLAKNCPYLCQSNWRAMWESVSLPGKLLEMFAHNARFSLEEMAGFPTWGYPKSSIWMGFSIQNHPAMGVPPWLWDW